MQEVKYLTFRSKKKSVALNTSAIIYVVVRGKYSMVHVAGGKIYQTRMTLGEIVEQVGDDFIKINRGCIVSALAIHDITDRVYLNNGETLGYTIRKKKQIIEKLHSKKKYIFKTITEDENEKSQDEYGRYYESFDNLPFAFTDIEIVFDDESHAVDWVFRYGNHALARLEKVPLDKLIGSSFSSLFPNMDSKWLLSYERAALYGEMLEVVDYSPEIDEYLKVICFPTFKGHCGCILFSIPSIEYAQGGHDAEAALSLFLEKPKADRTVMKQTAMVLPGEKESLEETDAEEMSTDEIPERKE